MKPKRAMYCLESRKRKILFDTEKKANTFMKFNAEDIEKQSGYRPIRSYFCISCGGYHVTSKILEPGLRSRSEIAMEADEERRRFNREGRARMKEIKKLNKTI